ncbi:hypothetical protein M413DRAFT_347395 [Hebeloma cylindrosporum]|uniref:Uncharacterized protein n=1 Tax=Hebeloma cylindrosporum TaxID=76867 RepID=A0A0C2XCL6_HEBCY|nr:hypothetical protein M413DRAFT_347395 [Hebeloma cylindrosporum h7]
MCKSPLHLYLQPLSKLAASVRLSTQTYPTFSPIVPCRDGKPYLPRDHKWIVSDIRLFIFNSHSYSLFSSL